MNTKSLSKLHTKLTEVSKHKIPAIVTVLAVVIVSVVAFTIYLDKVELESQHSSTLSFIEEEVTDLSKCMSGKTEVMNKCIENTPKFLNQLGDQDLSTVVSTYKLGSMDSEKYRIEKRPFTEENKGEGIESIIIYNENNDEVGSYEFPQTIDLSMRSQWNFIRSYSGEENDLVFFTLTEIVFHCEYWGNSELMGDCIEKQKQVEKEYIDYGGLWVYSLANKSAEKVLSVTQMREDIGHDLMPHVVSVAPLGYDNKLLVVASYTANSDKRYLYYEVDINNFKVESFELR